MLPWRRKPIPPNIFFFNDVLLAAQGVTDALGKILIVGHCDLSLATLHGVIGNAVNNR